MPQYPGQKFDATLVTLSNAMIQATRSMQVSCSGQFGRKLYGGAYCRVDFQVPGDPNMVRLPATALMPANRGTQVAILGGDGKVALRRSSSTDFGDTSR